MGRHSSLLVRSLGPQGKIIAIDRDRQSLDVAKANLSEMSSQFYDHTVGDTNPARTYRPPRWVRTQVIDPYTMQPARPGLGPPPVQGQQAVFHLASQVAVTHSVENPRHDLEVNLLGTFNLLEALRAQPRGQRPVLIFPSTNKVYGSLRNVPVLEQPRRYAYAGSVQGISESQNLDFYSPYGCSKGAADQYVLDYARIYDLPSVVFRMSCIYGPHQYGTEDQGWVAHFLIFALLNKPLTICGNGKQVRDLLFVDDLIDAYLAAVDRIDRVKGEAFNMGGGIENSLSLLELMDWLNQRCPHPVAHAFSDWRPGDQRIYISDIAKAQEKLGWAPRVKVAEGLERLWNWVQSHRADFLD
jgi:CDP-paratose 2-epimerase